MVDPTGRAEGGPIEIVGVVDNVPTGDLSEPPPPRVYRPLPSAASLASVAFAVRVAGDPAAVAPAIREALRAEDRDLAASQVQPARREIDNTMRTYNLILSLFAGFATVGLLVAVTGVYGVTAFSVGQRRHEIGVRVALGATAGDVVRLIAVRTARLIGAGALIGLVGGWAIGVAIRRILVGVGAADPVTFAGVLLIIGISGFVATYLPAHRALAIDPVSVLKRE